MGKNSKQSSGADAGGNLLYFSPEKITVVEDKSHPLYDERVELPVDESLVANIMMFGVLEPIIVRHNGYDGERPIIEAVDGRQRVRACIEANKRLVAQGKEPHRIPAVMKRAEQGTLMGVMISTNEHRRSDSPLIKARKLERYLSTGKTEDEAAVTFGVSKATIKNMLKLLELHPKVQTAVESGEVPATVAKELGALPQEKQPEALAKMIESGATKGAAGAAAVRNAKNGGEATATKARMRSRKQLEGWKKAMQKKDGKVFEVASAVLSYVLGNDRALSNLPQLRDLVDGK